MGLVLGILPGIGGLAGTALLLPFTFGMEPIAAMALLLGLGATTSTGDPIPAVLFGVPGGAGSAATVLDGLPMASRGEASRALSASYMSSLLGGLFGAALMGLTIPMLRPIMLYIGSPELLAFSILGISFVATLSGNAPLRGLAAAALGIMIAMIGSDPQTGTLRYTFDTLYLWEGAPLTPIILGLFALPELADLAISRTAIAGNMAKTDKQGMWQGAKDCFEHWWLIMRCSWIGGGLGAVPGIGGAVVDWVAYGHAARTEKGAGQTFGKGDVRGVIASESSNNAKEGGALVPTVAFGVPGSAGMAILLGAFMIHGLVPGPDMLSKNLHITYSMVWSIALANILGAGLCYLFSEQFAKLATLRYTLILPVRARHHLHRRLPGLAQLGRPVDAAHLRSARLDDEAVEVAASAADPRPRAGRHHRALPVHLDPALRHRLVRPSDRHRHLRDLRARACCVRLLQDVRREGGVVGHASGLRQAGVQGHAADACLHACGVRLSPLGSVRVELLGEDRPDDRRFARLRVRRHLASQRGVAPRVRSRRPTCARKRRTRSSRRSTWISTPTRAICR